MSDNNQQFEHRVQTNQAVFVGVITRSPNLRLIGLDGETGEVTRMNAAGTGPLEATSFQIRVDQNETSMFVDVEGFDVVALMAQQLKRRETVQLTGRLVITTVKKPIEGAFDDEGNQKFRFYQNYKLSLVDRRNNFDGTFNESAPPPIMLVPAQTKHQAAILYYGTVGNKGVRQGVTGNNRLRTRFSAANNGGSANNPKVSWFDTVCYGDVARDTVNIGKGSLVKVMGKVHTYKVSDEFGSLTKIEVIASQVTPIALKEASPAQSLQTGEANALSVLRSLAALSGESMNESIDDQGGDFDPELDDEEAVRSQAAA